MNLDEILIDENHDVAKAVPKKVLKGPLRASKPTTIAEMFSRQSKSKNVVKIPEMNHSGAQVTAGVELAQVHTESQQHTLSAFDKTLESLNEKDNQSTATVTVESAEPSTSFQQNTKNPKRVRTSLPKSQSVQDVPPSKKPRETYHQGFSETWLKNEAFIPWLEKRYYRSKGEFRPWCICCEWWLTNGKSDIERHSKTKKHLRNLHLVPDILEQRNEMNAHVDVSTASAEKVAVYEMTIVSMVAQKNLAILDVETVIATNRRLHPKDPVLKRVQLGRTRATAIIKDGFGVSLFQELLKKLKIVSFSIIIDETTDISKKKALAIIYTYWCPEKLTIVVGLLEIVECADGTAAGLTASILNLLDTHGIPRSRFIGFSADTCNVMFGKKHSVSTLLKEEVPSIVVVKCSCHSIHLASCRASRKLPEELESGMCEIFNHFAHSSARQREFSEFQDFAGVAKHIIFSPEATRWLSLQECVDRLLEQHNPLDAYFTAENFDNPENEKVVRILQLLKKKTTVAYLQFLSYFLGIMNEFNTIHQQESPQAHNLPTLVDQLIKDLAGNFTHGNYVRATKGLKIDPELSNQYVSFDKLYLGPLNSQTVAELELEPQESEEDDIETLKWECREVYKEAIVQIKKRFVFDDDFFHVSQLVLPRQARNLNPPNLYALFKRFPELKNLCDPAKAEMEWRSHSLIPLSSLGCLTEDAVGLLQAESYWQLVLNLRINGDSSVKRFPNLAVIISFLSSIPCSNAASERVFSVLKLNKTAHRNRLSNEVFGSLVRMKEFMKHQDKECHDVEFSDELVSRVMKVRCNKSVPVEK